jgi:hypothetical protein
MLLTSASRCSGIEPLIDLLFGSDIASQVFPLLPRPLRPALHAPQVCASGALLNCIGPSLSPVFEHPRRKTLRKVGMRAGGEGRWCVGVGGS